MPKSSAHYHNAKTSAAVGVFLIGASVFLIGASVFAGFAAQPISSEASALVLTKGLASTSRRGTLSQLRPEALLPDPQLIPATEFSAGALALGTREPSSSLVTDLADSEPMTLVVSLSDQQIDVYRGSELITSSKISTGMPGYATKPGVFSILEKRRYHHSNMYSGAPMPWMQRLTRSGTAVHGGVVPRYPASHGCIRVPFSFAPRLFQITTLGEHVVVARNRVAPKLIEHPTLFQPLPPGVATEAHIQQRPKNDPGEAAVPTALAKEGVEDVATSDGLLASEPLASEDPAHPATEPLTNQAETADKGAPIDSIHATVNVETHVGAGFQTVERSVGTFDDQADKPSSKGHAVVKGRSLAPLRILVTRRTQRDRIISLQYILSSMGYLAPQNFSGRLGQATVTAIRAFQKENGMRETGTFTDDLVEEVYSVAGKEEPPEGHLFVRQEFRPVFDVPIAFDHPDQMLGTHIFTALRFAPDDTRTQWMAISLDGDDATSVLDRIQIPNDVRQKISERLTPGSSLIIGDTSVNSAILPAGDDFLVWAGDTPVAREMDWGGHTVVRVYRGMDVEEVKVMRAPAASPTP